MSLVAYDCSSDSGDEDAKDEELISNEKATVHSDLNKKSLTFTNLFTSLPQPINAANSGIEELQDEFLLIRESVKNPMKRKKQPIKISVPSLQEFNDDGNEECERKLKPKVISSVGLFNLLPPPKGTAATSKSFIPNVLMNKQHAKLSIKKIQKAKVAESIAATSVTKNADSDDDDTDISETFDLETWQKVCGRQPKRIRVEPTNVEEIGIVIEAAPAVEEPLKPYSGLDNAAFKELVGKSNKIKKESIEIIDIHEDELMPDPDIWKTKALTDPNQEPTTASADDSVNEVSKKKHHITYLAQKAKTMEQELKNQWANNRMTRQQTQAKYGF